MNFDLIDSLPRTIHQDDPDGGVLRPWVRALSLRYQGVLVTAIRGCDGAPKEDRSKSLSRMLRRAILNPADERETTMVGGFFGFDPNKLKADLHAFLHSLDAYPLHYVMHLMHAVEVIGYEYPPPPNAADWEYYDGQLHLQMFFLEVYVAMCHTLHVNPERREQMAERLTADRIAAGTTETNFPKPETTAYTPESDDDVPF